MPPLSVGVEVVLAVDENYVTSAFPLRNVPEVGSRRFSLVADMIRDAF